MKNLKKVLALVLAFACAFTMFAGAAFTDQADISDVNADAVELLTTLNIIQGDPDGSFAPEREVTRAEMAKMIYTIRNNGNDDASAYETVTTSFTDISGHWAEGYIKYLQNTGIVAGKSAYIFDPDSTVTTGEAMKMALVLAGYRADKAELTGTKWLNNTVSLATTVGMTKDVQSAIAGGCTRQDAAQVLYNTLTDVYAVQWSEVTNSFLNDSKQGLAWSGDPITVGNKWMDLTIYVGRMTSSGELAIAGNDAGKDRFIVDVDTKDNASWEDVLTFKDGKDHTDLVGQEVKVLTGDKIDEVYGVYATGTSQVVETTMDQVDVETDYDLKVDGTVYDAKAAKVYADLSAASTVAKVFTANGEAVADSVKMIDWDNNGKYETILVNTVAAAKVNYVSSTSITLGSVGSRVNGLLKNGEVLEFADNTIAEDLAKNDFAVVTKNVYDDSWNVAKADVVTGTVDGKVDNERKVRVDGTWYTLANNKVGAQADNSDLYTVPNSRTEFVNKDAITLYVVGGIAYYAESTKGNDVNRSVLMVYDVQDEKDQWGSKNQIKVIFPTDTKETVTVASDSSVAFGDIKVGQMYYYTTNNDGDYLLTVLANDGEKAGYDKVVNDPNGIYNEDSFGGQTIADEAIVFALVGNDDAKVYSGKAVKDAALTGAKTKVANGQLGQALQDTDNGFTYTRMMNIDIDDDTIDTTTNYGYLLADGTYSYNKELGCYIMEYEFWNGSEVVNAIEKTSSNKEKTLVKHSIIAYAMDDSLVSRADTGSDSVMIKDVKIASGLTYASMVGYSNGKVSLLYDEDVPAKVANVDADTITFYVDSSASNSANIGQTGDGWDYVAPSNQINVAYVMDNDNEDVKFIVIDVEGQLSGKGSVGDSDDNDDNEQPQTSDVAKVSNVRVNNTGTMRATLTVDRANTWIADTGVVTVPWTAYDADGNYMDEGTQAFASGVTTATISASGFDANQTGVTIEIGEVTSTVVDVRFFNGTTELTVGAGKQVTTTKATVDTTSGSQQLDVTANWLAGKVSAKADYEIKGATGTTLTGNVADLTDASGVAKSANIGDNDTKALGTGYVDVVFSNVTDSGSKYSVTYEDNIDTGIALSDLTVTDGDTADDAKTIKIEAGKTTGIAKDEQVKISVTLSAVPTKLYGYKVAVNVNGEAKTFTLTNNTAAEFYTTVTGNVTINKASIVSVTGVEKVGVVADDSKKVAVQVAGFTYRIPFNMELDMTQIETTDVTNDNDSAAATCKAVSFENGYLVVTFDKAVDDSKTIKIAANKAVSKDDANNKNAAQITLTLSNNEWTLS